VRAQEPVAVVGGGLGGLAAAAVLAARGYRVRLFDKNHWLGGKAAVLEQNGFRFDMGPTILTVPEVLRRIYAEAGRNVAAELDLIRLDPQWRCFFDDGSVLDLVEDAARMAESLHGYTGDQAAGDGYLRFLELSARLHDISRRFFFWRSVEDMRDTIDIRQNFSPSTLADVLALRMGATVAGTIRRRVKDGRVAQMLDHFTQYVGSSPYGSPAVLCSIAHMQTDGGVWYPRGGTRAVAGGLVALGESLGGTYEPGRGIARIETERGRVAAVIADDGERIPVSAVVSNMDSVRTYRELVGGTEARRSTRRDVTNRLAQAWCCISA
jgi:diapolycopene oxygenase